MIGLADCNSFYVSCEKAFRPDLEGLPVGVLTNNVPVFLEKWTGEFSTTFKRFRIGEVHLYDKKMDCDVS